MIRPRALAPPRPPGDDEAEGQRAMARGTLVGLAARAGALFEAASLPLFVWAYGAAGYGLFAAGWALLKVASAIAECGLAIALQRYAAGADPAAGRAAVRLALTTAALVSAGLAALLSATAGWWAPILTGDGPGWTVAALRLYVWVLPLWTVLEVATAAVRATARFGPEVKIRVAYEQGLRLLFGISLAGLGMLQGGLFLAHALSVGLAALLALRLVGRSYPPGLGAVLSEAAPAPSGMRDFAVAMMPVPVMRKAMSEAPVMMLSALAGPAAAALYAVARKVASVMQALRLSVDYAMAPLLAGKTRGADSAAAARLAGFALRLTAAAGPPVAATLLVLRTDILRLFEPSFAAAAAPMGILVLARLVEALCTPASVVVEMTRGRWLPALNTASGLAVMVVGTLVLARGDGDPATAAALAASAGMVLSGLLAVTQTVFAPAGPGADGLSAPLHALLAGLGGAALVGAAGHLAAGWSPLAASPAAVLALAPALVLAFRFGLRPDDRANLRRP